MATHTKETRQRPMSAGRLERVNLAIADMREIIGTGRFNRGEVVGMLCSLLGGALYDGVASDRREVLLDGAVTLIRQLWAEQDAKRLQLPPDPPVM